MDSGVKVSIIAAIADNGVIGRDGDVPWRLAADLKRFKSLTTGHALIVGRKTHEAILKRLGHPLAERRTIVLTLQSSYRVEGCEVVASWEEALACVTGEGEIFVIGGGQLYALMLPLADTLYLSHVHARPAGDTFFPRFDWREWAMTSQEYCPADAKNDYPHTFAVWRRVRKEVSTHGRDRAALRLPRERPF